MAFLGQVLLYTIPGCPFCTRSKQLLSIYEVPYIDVSLDRYPGRRYEMQERTGRRTVPQIFFNGRHIGGFDDLKKLHEEGSLEEIFREVAETEPPAGAPPPPPAQESEDEEDGNELLPSQRETLDTDYRGCSPDELASLVREIQDSSLVKTHTYHLKGYKNTFIGRDLVTWLVETRKYKSRSDAVQLGQELYLRHFIHHVTFDHEFKDERLFYRLLGDGYARALNAKLSYACIPRPASEVADDLRRYIVEIYSEHLSPDAFSVDYRAISVSRKFEAYVRATAELKRIDLKNLPQDEKIAFFINIYNALIIHAFVVQGPPNNMWKRLKFFSNTSYIIGGRCYSLNDIENGVLRGNRKPVAAIRRPFSRSDPRLKVALPSPEPRVHFALVCGAKSCPPIKTYSATHLDEELTLATEAFFESESLTVDQERGEITISMILRWYREDFGANNHEMLQWVHSHMASSPKKTALSILLERNYRLRFQKYNWDLNSN